MSRDEEVLTGISWLKRLGLPLNLPKGQGGPMARDYLGPKSTVVLGLQL